MTDTKDVSNNVENLYRELTGAFPHPFDWMYLLHRPPVWRWKMRKAHFRAAAIFRHHGFYLTEAFAYAYHRLELDDWQHYGEDAGGKICRKLRRALMLQDMRPLT